MEWAQPSLGNVTSPSLSLCIHVVEVNTAITWLQPFFLRRDHEINKLRSRENHCCYVEFTRWVVNTGNQRWDHETICCLDKTKNTYISHGLHFHKKHSEALHKYIKVKNPPLKKKKKKTKIIECKLSSGLNDGPFWRGYRCGFWSDVREGFGGVLIYVKTAAEVSKDSVAAGARKKRSATWLLRSASWAKTSLQNPHFMTVYNIFILLPKADIFPVLKAPVNVLGVITVKVPKTLSQPVTCTINCYPF